MLKSLLNEKGNYRRIRTSEIDEHITYFGNTICIINHKYKVFKLDNCGYGWSRSTTRALNDCRRYFTNLGYIELVDLEINK